MATFTPFSLDPALDYEAITPTSTIQSIYKKNYSK